MQKNKKKSKGNELKDKEIYGIMEKEKEIGKEEERKWWKKKFTMKK